MVTSSPSPSSYPIFIAVDRVDYDAAAAIAKLAARHHCGIKLGLAFFIANGPQACERLLAETASECGRTPLFFLDLKLHDIPNTVKDAMRAALMLHPDFITLHAGGGQAMMAAAIEEIKTQNSKTKAVAVTVLTSLGAQDLDPLGYKAITPLAQVMRYANLALQSGVKTLVCAPHEITAIKDEFGDALRLITPGIRPQGADIGDQQRVMTPKDAFDAGADYLVIGRPITAAPSPDKALSTIIQGCF